MSQHTPGPWKVHPLRSCVWDKDCIGHLDIHGPNGEEILSGPLPVERVADARLIAKAPEMYRMLASCLAYFDDMKHAGSKDLLGLQRQQVESSRVTGKDFAPDARWLAPIRALLEEIKGKTP